MKTKTGRKIAKQAGRLLALVIAFSLLAGSGFSSGLLTLFGGFAAKAASSGYTDITGTIDFRDTFDVNGISPEMPYKNNIPINNGYGMFYPDGYFPGSAYSIGPESSHFAIMNPYSYWLAVGGELDVTKPINVSFKINNPGWGEPRDFFFAVYDGWDDLFDTATNGWDVTGYYGVAKSKVSIWGAIAPGYYPPYFEDTDKESYHRLVARDHKTLTQYTSGAVNSCDYETNNVVMTIYFGETAPESYIALNGVKFSTLSLTQSDFLSGNATMSFTSYTNGGSLVTDMKVSQPDDEPYTDITGTIPFADTFDKNGISPVTPYKGGVPVSSYGGMFYPGGDFPHSEYIEGSEGSSFALNGASGSVVAIGGELDLEKEINISFKMGNPEWGSTTPYGRFVFALYDGWKDMFKAGTFGWDFVGNYNVNGTKAKMSIWGGLVDISAVYFDPPANTLNHRLVVRDHTACAPGMWSSAQMEFQSGATGSCDFENSFSVITLFIGDTAEESYIKLNGVKFGTLTIKRSDFSNGFATMSVSSHGSDAVYTTMRVSQPTPVTVTYASSAPGFTKIVENHMAGDIITRPASAQDIPDFTFIDWYADATYTTTFNFSVPIAGNTMIYAKYKVNAVSGVYTDSTGSIPFANTFDKHGVSPVIAYKGGVAVPGYTGMFYPGGDFANSRYSVGSLGSNFALNGGTGSVVALGGELDLTKPINISFQMGYPRWEYTSKGAFVFALYDGWDDLFTEGVNGWDFIGGFGGSGVSKMSFWGSLDHSSPPFFEDTDKDPYYRIVARDHTASNPPNYDPTRMQFVSGAAGSCDYENNRAVLTIYIGATASESYIALNGVKFGNGSLSIKRSDFPSDFATLSLSLTSSAAAYTNIRISQPGPAKVTYTSATAGFTNIVSNHQVDEIITRPASAQSIEGYVFVNWYEDSACRTPFDFAAPLSGDTTIYAKYSLPGAIVTPDPTPDKPGETTVSQGKYTDSTGKIDFNDMFDKHGVTSAIPYKDGVAVPGYTGMFYPDGEFPRSLYSVGSQGSNFALNGGSGSVVALGGALDITKPIDISFQMGYPGWEYTDKGAFVFALFDGWDDLFKDGINGWDFIGGFGGNGISKMSFWGSLDHSSPPFFDDTDKDPYYRIVARDHTASNPPNYDPTRMQFVSGAVGSCDYENSRALLTIYIGETAAESYVALNGVKFGNLSVKRSDFKSGFATLSLSLASYAALNTNMRVSQPGAAKVTFTSKTPGFIDIVQNHRTGDIISAPASAQEIEGYSFKGWYEDADCKNKYDFSSPLSGDTFIYALYLSGNAKIPSGYTDSTGGVNFEDTFDRHGISKTIPYKDGAPIAGYAGLFEPDTQYAVRSDGTDFVLAGSYLVIGGEMDVTKPINIAFQMDYPSGVWADMSTRSGFYFAVYDGWNDMFATGTNGWDVYGLAKMSIWGSISENYSPPYFNGTDNAPYHRLVMRDHKATTQYVSGMDKLQAMSPSTGLPGIVQTAMQNTSSSGTLFDYEKNRAVMTIYFGETEDESYIALNGVKFGKLSLTQKDFLNGFATISLTPADGMFLQARMRITQPGPAKVTYTSSAPGFINIVETYAVDDIIKKPSSVQAIEGLFFGGWFEDAACSIPYNFAYPLSGNTVIYAKYTSGDEKRVSGYTDKTGKIDFADTFDVNGISPVIPYKDGKPVPGYGGIYEPAAQYTVRSGGSDFVLPATVMAVGGELDITKPIFIEFTMDYPAKVWAEMSKKGPFFFALYDGWDDMFNTSAGGWDVFGASKMSIWGSLSHYNTPYFDSSDPYHRIVMRDHKAIAEYVSGEVGSYNYESKRAMITIYIGETEAESYIAFNGVEFAPLALVQSDFLSGYATMSLTSLEGMWLQSRMRVSQGADSDSVTPPAPGLPGTGGSGNPKTGDNPGLALAIGLAALSGACATAMLIQKKKSRGGEKREDNLNGGK